MSGEKGTGSIGGVPAKRWLTGGMFKRGLNLPPIFL
jgi:hypothetical protein